VCLLSSSLIFLFLSRQFYYFCYNLSPFWDFYEPLLLRHWTHIFIFILQLILGCPLSFLPSPSSYPRLYSNTQVIFIQLRVLLALQRVPLYPIALATPLGPNFIDAWGGGGRVGGMIHVCTVAYMVDRSFIQLVHSFISLLSSFYFYERTTS
jgi:hypothetical protein